MTGFQAFPLLRGQIRVMGETWQRANHALMTVPAVRVA